LEERVNELEGNLSPQYRKRPKLTTNDLKWLHLRFVCLFVCLFVYLLNFIFLWRVKKKKYFTRHDENKTMNESTQIDSKLNVRCYFYIYLLSIKPFQIMELPYFL
jgi:heme/copper-type cytochrome/quinol oxidase subunit 2